VLDAFEAAKKAGAPSGIVFETRGVTPWRMFLCSALWRCS
jgi:hypothetical protein